MGRLLLLDLRLLARDRLALAALAALLLACGVAFANGRALLGNQIAARAISATENREAAEAFRKGFTASTEPADAILRASRASLPVTSAVPTLADFSAGRASYAPQSTLVRLRSRPDTLFKRTELGNPELLARGSLDLAFVAVLVAPLLLIALGYGVFSADRDSGAARLILAQGGGPLRLLAARSVIRLSLVALPVALTAALLLVSGPDLPGRAGAAGRWLLVAGLLLLFWWAVVLLVNSLRVTAETAALLLVGLWAALTLVAPVLVAALAQLAYPPPSRFDEIAAARAVEISATTDYENDHPDLASQDFAGRLASVRKSLAIGRTIDEAVAPVSARFDERFARQGRAAGALRYVSPPLVAGDALAAAAGTDAGTQLAFRRAAYAYLREVKAALARSIESGRPLTAAEYDSLPRFAHPRRPASALGSVLFLLVAMAAVGGLAVFRLNQTKLD